MSAPASDLLEVVHADDRSPLSFSQLRLAVGETRPYVASADEDTVLFCVEGHVRLERDGERHDVPVASAAIVRAGESITLTAATDASLALFGAGHAADRHAPLGPDARVAAVDHADDHAATGRRAFQVLFGPENGCCHATLFVGYIPPGKASWHYHLYDEIIWIWQGLGRYHVGDSTRELTPGSALRIRPRDVHIVENLSPSDELVLLGLFTPAGSPSAAYLPNSVSG